MDEKKPPEEYPVPNNTKEFEELCRKVGIRKAMEIAGITVPVEWLKPKEPPHPTN